MGDSATAPVMAGLAVGIAFVVIFSLVSFPATALTDEELVEKTKSLEEVQLFLEMHPDAEIEIERDDARSKIDVRYSVTKQVMEPTSYDNGIRTKVLFASVNSQGDASISKMLCQSGARGILTFHVTTDAIANRCIVDSETEVEHIDMTIIGLDGTYRAGEPIIFSVKVEGVSDSADVACNSYPPAVVIRDDTLEKGST